MSQENRVVERLIEHGSVSRNYYIDLPYDKITRLSGIILRLRSKGWVIETKETERDTIYEVDKTCVGYVEALKEYSK